MDLGVLPWELLHEVRGFMDYRTLLAVERVSHAFRELAQGVSWRQLYLSSFPRPKQARHGAPYFEFLDEVAARRLFSIRVLHERAHPVPAEASELEAFLLRTAGVLKTQALAISGQRVGATKQDLLFVLCYENFYRLLDISADPHQIFEDLGSALISHGCKKLMVNDVNISIPQDSRQIYSHPQLKKAGLFLLSLAHDTCQKAVDSRANCNAAQANLALAKHHLANLKFETDPEEAKRLWAAAEEHFARSLQLADLHGLPNSSMSLNNLGNLLADAAVRVGGEEGEEMWQRAMRHFEEAKTRDNGTQLASSVYWQALALYNRASRMRVADLSSPRARRPAQRPAPLLQHLQQALVQQQSGPPLSPTQQPSSPNVSFASFERVPEVMPTPPLPSCEAGASSSRTLTSYVDPLDGTDVEETPEIIEEQPADNAAADKQTFTSLLEHAERLVLDVSSAFSIFRLWLAKFSALRGNPNSCRFWLGESNLSQLCTNQALSHEDFDSVRSLPWFSLLVEKAQKKTAPAATPHSPPPAPFIRR
jgi:hypothetical protein